MSGSGNFERRAKTLTQELEEMEETVPEVKRAKRKLVETTDRIIGKGPALSFEQVRDIYGADQTFVRKDK